MRLFTGAILSAATAVEYEYYFTEYDADTGAKIGQRKATDREICQYKQDNDNYCLNGRCDFEGNCKCKPPFTFYQGSCHSNGIRNVPNNCS